MMNMTSHRFWSIPALALATAGLFAAILIQPVDEEPAAVAATAHHTVKALTSMPSRMAAAPLEHKPSPVSDSEPMQEPPSRSAYVRSREGTASVSEYRATDKPAAASPVKLPQHARPAPLAVVPFLPIASTTTVTDQTSPVETTPTLSSLPLEESAAVEPDWSVPELLADETPPEKVTALARASPSSPEYWVTVQRTRPQAVLELRVAVGSWKPVASRHVRFHGPTLSEHVVFQLPAGARRADYRVMSYTNAKFPTHFVQGEIEFPSSHTAGLNHGLFTNHQTQVMSSSNISLSSSSTTTTAAIAAMPEPLEADIWQIVGSRLFFFNQYRGLQVFDLTHPAAPVKTGTLRLAASGEQMYALNADGSLLALIEKAQPSYYNQSQESTPIHIIRVTQGVPMEIARVNTPGSYLDSRLVGQQLHLITQPSSWPSLGGRFITVDLSAPQQPVIASDHTLPGYSPKLQVVGDHALVATTRENDVWGWGWTITQASQLSLFRLVPHSAAVSVKTLPLKGTVIDKWKMHLVSGAVAVVTQSRDTNWELHTWVETYPLSGTATTALAIAEIPAAFRETLHATRFNGSRCYVVTFRRIDPLFVVDLADPAQPQITGELEIPGWSTYLEPRGDQLLAVGVEQGRVTASLFDVHDPAAPALLSRVAVGAPGVNSWSESEANYDEKAVEFLPDEGLLLMPFRSYSYDSNWNWTSQNGIQTVHVGTTTLTLAETIPQASARRGSIINGHIVTISGRELIVSDRSRISGTPVAQLSLSWSVDQVIPFGSYLIQIERGGSAWGNRITPMLRVTTAADPDTLIEEIEIGPEAIAGIEHHGDELFLAQWLTRTTTGMQMEYGLRTWRLDLSHAPEVRETGCAETWFDSSLANYRWNTLSAVWPSAERLVWHVGGSYRGSSLFNYTRNLPVTTVQPVMTIMPITIIQPGSPIINHIGIFTADARLFPVRLRAEGLVAEAPILLPGRADGPPAAQGGFLLWSHTSSQKTPRPDAPGMADPPRATPIEVSISEPRTVQPSEIPVTGHFVAPEDQLVTLVLSHTQLPQWTALTVVDFNQPTPVVRDAVPLPGPLVAVSHLTAQGGIIVTANAKTEAQVLRTLAYDGVACWSFDDPVMQTLHSDDATAANHDSLFQFRLASQAESFSYHLGRRAFELRDTWALPTPLDEQLSQFELRGAHLIITSQNTSSHLHAAQIGPRGQMSHRRSAILPAPNLHRHDSLATPDPGGAGVFIPYREYGVEFTPWQAD